MFAWAPIPPRFAHLGSVDFSKLLMAKAKVAVAPGIGFGEYGDTHVRIALVENNHRLRQAIRNIRDFLATDNAGPVAPESRRSCKCGCPLAVTRKPPCKSALPALARSARGVVAPVARQCRDRSPRARGGRLSSPPSRRAIGRATAACRWPGFAWHDDPLALATDDRMSTSWWS